jgi:hypothetical protein
MHKIASTCAPRVARQLPHSAAALATRLLFSTGSHAQQPQQARIVVTGDPWLCADALRLVKSARSVRAAAGVEGGAAMIVGTKRGALPDGRGARRPHDSEAGPN